jgi:hypothetical protein
MSIASPPAPTNPAIAAPQTSIAVVLIVSRIFELRDVVIVRVFVFVVTDIEL